VLIDPAAGQEAAESVACGCAQAGEGAYQQMGVEGDGAGAGQQGHAAQAKQHPGQLRRCKCFGKEQRSDDDPHHGRGRVENGGVAGRQELGRQRVECERNARIDHAQNQAQLQFSAEVPADPHHRQDGQQAHTGERHP